MTQLRPRVFLDSNVIFSALYGASGAPRRMLVLTAEGVFEGLISTQVEPRGAPQRGGKDPPWRNPVWRPLGRV